MGNSILKLIDFEKINILLEGFNKTTGFVTAILDLDGNILSQSGWRQICVKYHRVHPETAKRCTESDTILAGKMAEGEKYHFYKCLNGLVDVSVPLVIKGEHIANLFSGQFFFEEPDHDFFIKQAEKYKFNGKEYLELLEKVPVVSKEKAKIAMDFLLDMTQLIADMTYQKLEQTELKEAVIKSSVLIDSIIDNSSALVYVTDLDGKFQMVNSEFEKLFNLPKDKFIGKYRTEFMPKGIAEQHRNNDLTVIRIKETITIEEENIEPDGTHYYLTQKFPLFDLNGEVYAVGGISTDITESKLADELLVKEKQFLEAVFDNISEGIVACDANGILSRFNKATTEFHGLPEEQIPADEWADKYDLYHPDGITPMQKEEIPLFKALKDGFAKDVEMMIIPKNGVPRITVSNGQRLIDSVGNILGAVIAMHDITERKRAEEALSASEEKFRLAFQTIPDAISLSRLLDGIYIDINKGFTLITGYTTDEVIGKSTHELHLWDKLKDREEFVVLLKKHQKVENLEYTFTKKDGNKITGLVSASLLTINNESCVIAITRDISHIKRTQEQLQKSEIQFRTAFENSAVGMSLTSADGGFIQVNAKLCQFLGYTEEELLNLSFQSITYSDDITMSNSFVEKSIAQRSDVIHFEKRYVRKNGDIIWAEVSSSLLRDENGSPLYFITHIIDITERKLAEEALEKSRWLLVETQKMGKVGGWEIDLLTQQLTWTDELYRIHEVEEGFQPTVEKAIDFYAPDSKPIILAAVERAIEYGEKFDLELQIITAQGNVLDVHAIGAAIGEGGNPVRVLGTFQDITERKKAEKMLVESEKKIRQLLESTPLPICYVDKDDVIVYRNKRFIKDIGYDETEVPTLKEWWVKAYPDESYRNWVLPNWDSAVKNATEKGIDIESDVYKVTCKDGNVRELIISGSIINDSFLATFVDITERKKAESEIRNQLDELRKWHEVMIDREERVLELKNEVNELHLKLGNPLKYGSILDIKDDSL